MVKDKEPIRVLSIPDLAARPTLLHTLRCSVRGLACVLDDSVGCTLNIKKE